VKQSQQYPEQGGLAGSVGPDQAGNTGRDLETDLLESHHLSVVVGQTGEDDHRIGVVHHRPL
jgi:hypothetical protein